MLSPKVYVDHEAMSRAAADWIIERMTTGRPGPICLASGGTPTRTYEWVAERFLAGDFPTSIRPSLVKLDEWAGLSRTDPGSCEHHLRRTLIDTLGEACQFEGFDGAAPDSQAECQRLAEWLRQNGPLKASILGLGLNGHLGFNEPADVLQPHAHTIPLSPTSLAHAMLGERQVKPAYGMTFGMADLLQADEILLVVSGASKFRALTRLLRPEIDPHFPASFLWLHPRVELYCDAAAHRDPAQQ